LTVTLATLASTLSESIGFAASLYSSITIPQLIVVIGICDSYMCQLQTFSSGLSWKRKYTWN